MKFFGPIENNLFAAIRSAKRIRGHPIHPTTFQYWANLLHEGKETLRRDGTLNDRSTLQDLIGELEEQIRLAGLHR